MKKPDGSSLGPSGPQWWFEEGIPSTIRHGLKMALLHTERTPFQQMEIYEHDVLGRVLVLDGIVQTTQGDEYVYHEMLTHVPLLGCRTAKDPNRRISVLIIGGGDGGILREVLRHDWVERAVMVEIDEAVVRAAAEYLQINGDYEDPRVQLVIGDGSAYVKSAEVRQCPFDAILVDSPDPVGPGLKLFSDKFCRDLAACLSPAGVVVRQSGVAAYQSDVLQLAARQMCQVFGDVEVYRAAVPTYIGGDMAFTLATKDNHSCARSNRPFEGRYYNSDVHAAAFALPSDWRKHLSS